MTHLVVIQTVCAVITLVVTIILLIVTGKLVTLTKRLSDVSKSQFEFQKKSEKYKFQQEIINGALKFIFVTSDEIDKLTLKKHDYLETKKKHTVLSKGIKDKYFKAIDKLMQSEKFIPDFEYNSVQLKRLEDNDLWKDLEQIGDIYEDMLKSLVYSEDMEEFETIHSNYLEQQKNFVIKCLDICKLG
ncbi:MAG: hypothetical protein A2W27_01935 [Deltaproteobacteria bacterium RBG_16_44_11]|nr:MAG: hypothetical protein A2W27_01935 [Deltaproteobacteria bacterium RBG_16_44_11]